MKTTPEQYKALFARKRALVEKERIGFAKALHDDVSQSMTVLTIELALLQHRLGPEHPEATKVSDLLDLVTSVNKSVRDITNDIRPKILDEFGLVAALGYECKRVQRERGVRITFSSGVEDIALPPDVATEVFRWVQLVVLELIGKAKATNFTMELSSSGGILELRISADGEALSYQKLRSDDPLSLLSLEERSAWIGATIEISGNEQIGTTLVFKLPLPTGG